MNIKLVDHVLTLSMTGLLYGSELWLVCAFGFFIAKRRKAAAMSDNSELNASGLNTSGLPVSASQETCVKHSFNAVATPVVQAIKTETADESANEHVSKSASKPASEAATTIAAEIVAETTLKATAIAPQPPLAAHCAPQPSSQPNQSTLLPKVFKPINSPPLRKVRTPTRQPAITCAPVNWQQWKVSDLRKANIAQACGVKTRPVGSRRTLTKADLVAQYQQNLKRLTQAPPVKDSQTSQIA
jgi:hypothetical protein